MLIRHTHYNMLPPSLILPNETSSTAKCPQSITALVFHLAADKLPLPHPVLAMDVEVATSARLMYGCQKKLVFIKSIYTSAIP